MGILITHKYENNMSEEQAKYVKQSTTMKLNYRWEALNQHAEDESYYWTELYTPIGSFTIATNRTNNPGKFAVYGGRNQRPKVLVEDIEEGKEFVANHLREKAEELQSFIIPIILEEWINSPQELIPIPKLEDDFNYLRGFYDGVNKQLNTINK